MSTLLKQSTKNRLYSELLEREYPKDKYFELSNELSSVYNKVYYDTLFRLFGTDLVNNLIGCRDELGLIDMCKAYIISPRGLGFISSTNVLYPSEELNKGVAKRNITIRSTVSVGSFSRQYFGDSFIKNLYEAITGDDSLDIYEKMKEDKQGMLELYNVYLNFLEFESLKVNYLEDLVDIENNFLSSIKTEEDLKKKHPEIYDKYLEMKSVILDLEEESSELVKTGRDISEILTDFSDLIKIKEEEGN